MSPESPPQSDITQRVGALAGVSSRSMRGHQWPTPTRTVSAVRRQCYHHNPRDHLSFLVCSFYSVAQARLYHCRCDVSGLWWAPGEGESGREKSDSEPGSEQGSSWTGRPLGSAEHAGLAPLFPEPGGPTVFAWTWGYLLVLSPGLACLPRCPPGLHCR